MVGLSVLTSNFIVTQLFLLFWCSKLIESCCVTWPARGRRCLPIYPYKDNEPARPHHFPPLEKNLLHSLCKLEDNIYIYIWPLEATLEYFSKSIALLIFSSEYFSNRGYHLQAHIYFITSVFFFQVDSLICNLAARAFVRAGAPCSRPLSFGRAYCINHMRMKRSSWLRHHQFSSPISRRLHFHQEINVCLLSILVYYHPVSTLMNQGLFRKFQDLVR